MKSLKLNQLESQRLAKKEMKDVTGGSDQYYCTCGCKYANNGGSSVEANGMANADSGLHSSNNGECGLWLRSYDGSHLYLGWGDLNP